MGLVEFVKRKPVATLSWGLIVAMIGITVYATIATDRQQKIAYCADKKQEKECKEFLPEIYKNEKAQRQLEQSAIDQRQQELEQWFAGSGVESSCEEALKSKLRDPSSYERSGEFVRDAPADGHGKTLVWKFRAKNGFGGYNVSVGMCKATVDNGGTVEASVIGDQ